MSLIISTITNKYYNEIDKHPAFLTCPNGNIMLYEVIKNIDLLNINNIFIIVNKHIIEKYYTINDFKNIFSNINKNITIDTILENTKNLPETIYNCINKYNITNSIFIKDYKSIIKCKPSSNNSIYYIHYNNDNTILSRLDNKSTIQFDSLNHLVNISEKELVSNYIGIGGYIFENTDIFKKTYKELLKVRNINTFSIAHIIYKCILNNIIFNAIEIDTYYDFTYYEDWKKYCLKFKTLFIDIDGTLVLNSGEYSKQKWGDTDQLSENVKFLKELYKTGYIQIILTTSRKNKYEKTTLEQLKQFKIPYDNILFDLYHCKRYLVNDYADSNPYPSAIAINLKRNSNNLKELFSLYL